MKEYTVNYREKRKQKGVVFETSVTANTIEEARKYARADLLPQYTIISVKLAK